MSGVENGGTALGKGGQGWGKGCDTCIQLFQGQQLCAGKILLSLHEAGNAVRVFDVLLQGLVWIMPKLQPWCLAEGQDEGTPGALCYSQLCARGFIPEAQEQLNQLDKLELFGRKNHPPWQRGFPWVPSRERSSCSTRKQEQGVPAFMSNRWSEKRCEGAIWEQRSTELKPEQVKQAESRALGLRGSTEWRLGKPQGRKGTLKKRFSVLLSILIYKNCFLILLENLASFQSGLELQQDPCRGLVWSLGCWWILQVLQWVITNSVVPQVDCSAQQPGCFPSLLQDYSPQKSWFCWMATGQFHTHSDKYWFQLQLEGVGHTWLIWQRFHASSHLKCRRIWDFLKLFHQFPLNWIPILKCWISICACIFSDFKIIPTKMVAWGT